VDGSGNVYIADYDNLRVVKDTLSSGGYTQSTIVSGLDGSSIGATGIAVDGNGDVFLAYYGVASLYEETPSTSGGYTESAFPSGLVYPAGIAVDGAGNVYVADSGSGNVFKETPVSGGYTQSTVVNTGAEDLAPTGVAVDGSGNVFIAGTTPLLTAIRLDFADAPSLSFAATNFGMTSADSPQTVTVANSGNAPLSFPVPSTGNNPSIANSFTLTLDNNGASACPLVGAGSPSAGTLAAGATCELAIGFAPATAGPISGSLALTDNALNAAAPNYATQTIGLSGTGTQVTPAIAWGTPAAITYGPTLGPAQLNATASVPGTFSYSPALGTVLSAGAQTLKVTFTPTDNVDYTTTTSSVSLMVNEPTPTINWTTPAAITYGTALGAAQLNATSPVAGTFSYSPGLGVVLGAGTQTLTATFTPTDTADYTTATTMVSIAVKQATPTISWAVPAAIPYGTTLGMAQLNATASTPGTLSYSPAAGTVPSPGTQTLTVSFTPTDSTDYTTASATTLLMVNQGTASNTLASSAASVFVSNPVTFTATVVSSVGTPTGTVSFLDGTTLLATAVLSGGTATYTTSGLAAGTHSITAVYSGDANFAAMTSSPLAEVVEGFTLNTPSSGSTSATASPGGQVTYTLAITPPSGQTFAAPITFSVTGLPTGATATFSPATIAAGASATNVALTVQLPNTAKVEPAKGLFGGEMPVALGLVLLPFLGLRRRAQLSRLGCWILAGVGGAVLFATLTGCGGSSGSGSGSQTQTYSFIVTATSGSLSNTTTLSLTVE